ncbi:DUF4097 family beta strand repeat-containing protein [Longispora albida]|uniref:DUF4097 family beta strand repeat-containing protein n=1 Tax=Longispora albida TaxID=203523 RepID=UPI00035D989E|nr:DUF4097 family beta strand repeat-containing protein [Longispora albida]
MQQFDTTAPITAILDIPAGTVRFAAAERDGTVVEVGPADPSKDRDVKLAAETQVSYAEGVLRIAAPEKNQAFGSSGSVSVTVQLPAGSHVEVKAASAELRTSGRLGEVRYDGAHGSVEIAEAAGARITTQAGDIALGRITGPAEVRTAKGDIRIAEATGGALTLRTEAGDVTVGVAAGVSAFLDAGTSYGRISNALANTGSGSAQVTIHATTAYGNITARSL